MSKDTYTTIDRSTTGVRDFLFDEMERLANGQINEKRLLAMSKAADTALKSAVVDINVLKLVKDTKEGKDNGPRAVADLGLNLMLSKQTKA